MLTFNLMVAPAQSSLQSDMPSMSIQEIDPLSYVARSANQLGHSNSIPAAMFVPSRWSIAETFPSDTKSQVVPSFFIMLFCKLHPLPDCCCPQRLRADVGYVFFCVDLVHFYLFVSDPLLDPKKAPGNMLCLAEAFSIDHSLCTPLHPPKA